MDKDKVLTWMRIFHDKIEENQAYLSELDTPIGDGDHGGNMARGMSAVMSELSSKTPNTTADIFKIVAMQLLSKVGGASGPLYGSAFMVFAKVSDDAQPVDYLVEGLAMIQKRGKAEVGEKTMVDVWTKVIEALRKNSLTADKITAIVEDTKDIRATKGRASYVGERSIGHIDPGSYSSGLLFLAMLEAGIV